MTHWRYEGHILSTSVCSHILLFQNKSEPQSLIYSPGVTVTVGVGHPFLTY